MFKDYYQMREWLESFIPFVYGKEELGLERISYLLELLGNPQDKFKSVLVAGTSGKGSTAFYIAKLLQFAENSEHSESQTLRFF
jgi:folylpolyglutamate synthase/dihydropteroate synthase